MTKTGSSDFNKLPDGGNGQPIQIANSFATADISGTPKTSPHTYDTSEFSITVPDDGAELRFKASTDIRVGESSGLSSYFVVAADTWFTVMTGKENVVYFKADSAGGTLQFYINKI